MFGRRWQIVLQSTYPIYREIPLYSNTFRFRWFAKRVADRMPTVTPHGRNYVRKVR